MSLLLLIKALNNDYKLWLVTHEVQCRVNIKGHFQLFLFCMKSVSDVGIRDSLSPVFVLVISSTVDIIR